MTRLEVRFLLAGMLAIFACVCFYVGLPLLGMVSGLVAGPLAGRWRSRTEPQHDRWWDPVAFFSLLPVVFGFILFGILLSQIPHDQRTALQTKWYVMLPLCLFVLSLIGRQYVTERRRQIAARKVPPAAECAPGETGRT